MWEILRQWWNLGIINSAHVCHLFLRSQRPVLFGMSVEGTNRPNLQPKLTIFYDTYYFGLHGQENHHTVISCGTRNSAHVCHLFLRSQRPVLFGMSVKGIYRPNLQPKLTIFDDTHFWSLWPPRSGSRTGVYQHNSESRWHNFSEICSFTHSHSSKIDLIPIVFSNSFRIWVFRSRKRWLEQNPFKQRFQELSDLAQNQHIRDLERSEKFCMSEWVHNGLFWSNLGFRNSQTPNTVDFT